MTSFDFFAVFNLNTEPPELRPGPKDLSFFCHQYSGESFSDIVSDMLWASPPAISTESCS
jgi:hypothetical protein